MSGPPGGGDVVVVKKSCSGTKKKERCITMPDNKFLKLCARAPSRDLEGGALQCADTDR